MNIAEIVTTYGSPLYIYELSAIRDAYHKLKEALPAPSQLYYSLKANPHPAIVSQLVQLGCSCEVSSINELHIALNSEKGQKASEHILYTGPGKTRKEIRTAIERGVQLFSVESLQDMTKIATTAADLQRPVQLLLRINPDQGIVGPALNMTGVASQFGIDAAAIIQNPEIYRSSPYAPVIGYHIYTGTNITSVESLLHIFLAAIQQMAAVAHAQQMEPAFLDLGGGFGHAFAVSGTTNDFSPLKEPLQRALDASFPHWRSGSPQVVFEAGRYLSAASGSLLCTVEDVKVSKDRTFVVLDTGIHHLGGMSGLNRIPRQQPALQLQNEHIDQEMLKNVSVVGPLCTPLDYFMRGAELARVQPGDILRIPNVGAYGLTASLMGFLSRDTPIEIVLDEGIICHVSQIQLQRTTYDNI